jgi:hypothetical protein
LSADATSTAVVDDGPGPSTGVEVVVAVVESDGGDTVVVAEVESDAGSTDEAGEG